MLVEYVDSGGTVVLVNEAQICYKKATSKDGFFLIVFSSGTVLTLKRKG